MPDNNDYLQQLLNRVDQKLNEVQGDASSASSEPLRPKVFTSTGRFENAPSSAQDSAKDESTAPSAEDTTAVHVTSPAAPTAVASPAPVANSAAVPAPLAAPAPVAPEEDEEEDDDIADEDDTYDHEEYLPGNDTKTDEKAFSLSPDSQAQIQSDEPQTGSEDVFDWNVSEDVEKYLSSGDGGSIFERMPRNPEKKSLKSRMAERRRLKENTKQYMDRNSGERRGCFGMFFHIIFMLIVVALTILAVLYVLQTIADVTIIDMNGIIATVMDKINEYIVPLIARFKK